MALAPTATRGEPSVVAVPLFATRPALEPLVAEIAARQRAVLDSGRYILGPEVEAFESEFAAFIGRRHCIGVANGTDALTIALRALGVRPGDEVIVPGVSFFATAGAVVNAGATPVFADIDARTHCMTAATVEPLISGRTRALVPVHLFGNPAAMRELTELARAHGLFVLEDAAQAAGTSYEGRRAGALGDAACFSFYPGKNLGAVGDAGAILTDDDDVAQMARTLRAHGQADPWVHVEVGYNSRLDELQAAAPARAASSPRGLDDRAPCRRPRLRARGNRRAGRVPARDAGRPQRLSPLCGPHAVARRARRRPEGGRNRDSRVLHDAAESPARTDARSSGRAAAELGAARVGRPRAADGPGP